MIEAAPARLEHQHVLAGLGAALLQTGDTDTAQDRLLQALELAFASSARTGARISVPRCVALSRRSTASSPESITGGSTRSPGQARGQRFVSARRAAAAVEPTVRHDPLGWLLSASERLRLTPRTHERNERQAWSLSLAPGDPLDVRETSKRSAGAPPGRALRPVAARLRRMGTPQTLTRKQGLPRLDTRTFRRNIQIPLQTRSRACATSAI